VVWNLTVATRKTSWNTTAPLTTWSRMHLFPYVPALPSLQTGDVVPWLNEDIVPHTATGSDDSWDTGTIAAGESASVVITKAMTGGYYCRFHPAMLASLQQHAR
jgi:plastocyanin